LDWLSTSLLKGMSREGDRVIFWTAFVMSILHDGRPRASLSASNPSRKTIPPSYSLTYDGREEAHATSCSALSIVMSTTDSGKNPRR
jgi:hypothetical protein